MRLMINALQRSGVRLLPASIKLGGHLAGYDGSTVPTSSYGGDLARVDSQSSPKKKHKKSQGSPIKAVSTALASVKLAASATSKADSLEHPDRTESTQKQGSPKKNELGSVAPRTGTTGVRNGRADCWAVAALSLTSTSPFEPNQRPER